MFLLVALAILIRWYVLVLWARFILEWVRALNPRFRPRGLWLVLIEAVYAVTDPPVKLVRRIVPPVRLGPVTLDFSLLIVMIICWVALIFLG